ncbi:RING finger protein 141-like [Glandiceps talaboti]
MFRKLLEKATKLMGQAQTVIDEKLQRYGGVLGQLAVLKYDDFLTAVFELNEISCSLPDPHGKTLQFEVKEGTDSTVLWKSTVRIRCKKLNKVKQVEECRIMNLHQFVQLYNNITLCVSSQERSEVTASQGAAEKLPEALEASIILQSIGGYEGDVHECCICMDAKTDIILSCNHMYCEKCIDRWDVNHHKCPVCRQEMKNQKESWVLPEKPDEEEVADYVMGVADKAGAREPLGKPV